MDIYEDLQAFQPANEQEAADRDLILSRLETDPAVFDRSSVTHMACSIWTVAPIIHENAAGVSQHIRFVELDRRARGRQADLAELALRELEEETGVHGARLVPCGPGNVLSCEVLTVDGHVKRGAYVSSHLHLNVTYLAVADPAEHVRIKADENSGVKWAKLDEAVALSSEPWIRERIYRKLIEKTRELAPRFATR